jgi:aryl-phospho-beta-D-glucosidase BglC (GH1 family)
MRRTFEKKRGLFTILLLFFYGSLCAQVAPWDMIKRMSRGINIGNTMDAPIEGQWQAPIQEFYFDDYVDAGLTCVRIPIRWENHIASAMPFAIDSLWLNRVEQVIDWSLERDLVTIINAHHDDWLYINFPDNLEKFEKLWEQIAFRFQNKPAHLLFEIINEPYFDLSDAQVDTLNKRIFKIIRKYNPHRIILLTGGGLNSAEAVQTIDPPDDPYWMVYFHYYKPSEFTKGAVDTWGTNLDKQTIDDHFNIVKAWSDQYNVPVLLGEFGVDNIKPLKPRLDWYQYVINGAVNCGFAFALWCAGPGAGKYTYHRQKGMWEFEQLNVITGQKPFTMMPHSIPGTIEAEDFDTGGNRVAYSDRDSINISGYYRPEDGVEIDSLSDGNYSIFFDNPDEWLEYSVNVDSILKYSIEIRVSAENSGGEFQVYFNNTNMRSFAVPATGSKYNHFILRDSLFLNNGFHVMRITAKSAGFSIDKLTFSKIKEKNETGNLLINPGFEQGISGWTPRQCVMTIMDSDALSGESAVKISERTKGWAGPIQSVKEKLLESGPGYYTASGFFKAVKDTGIIAKVKVRLTYRGQDYHIAAIGKIDTAVWTSVSDTLLLTWDGELEDAIFFIQTVDECVGDFYADDVSLKFNSPITATEDVQGNKRNPGEFNLQNYPNPLNPETNISVTLPIATKLSLIIFDILGREIIKIDEDYRMPGVDRFIWNGYDSDQKLVSSGVYLVVLKTEQAVQIKKIMLIR